ncbi:MAG: hypothetical protein RIC80_11250 [Cyclobacteriaceae bacterium]
MREEQLHFEELRQAMIDRDPTLAVDKMMSSPAVVYQDKVFCFLNRKFNMVFKLGKGFDSSTLNFPTEEFSPFKSKKPLSGWFEVDFVYAREWPQLADQALTQLKSELT